MATVASPPHSPLSPRSPSHSTPQNQPPETNTNSAPLPPLNTSQASKRTPLHRPPSYAKSRMSTYSTTSRFSERGSRPISQAFPLFHSSLSYALVRDFAYPVAHPSHYGPPPASSEPVSGTSTPASDRYRRISDPANGAWDNAAPWRSDGYFSTQPLPQLAYGDGPPYSEDEDLHSPVVKSSRHKKSKAAHSVGVEHEYRDGRRSILAGVNEDGTKTYYVGDEDESADGPGGEYVTYPPDDSRKLAPDTYGQFSSHMMRGLQDRPYNRGGTEDSEDENLGLPDHNDSRYSRDYQFTIASPDEEMHGKAVALFDFERENENELPLTEGQIIWVSYRHGQGWLVAEDPKTRDTGLVPEEYVRLLRDIQGGLGSLGAEEETAESEESSPEGGTDQSPTKLERARSNSNSHGEKNTAVVSSFSTSSKDLDPHRHLLGEKQTPPQVIHYGSQSSTPTLRSPSGGTHGPRNFEELKESSSDESTGPQKEKPKAR